MCSVASGVEARQVRRNVISKCFQLEHLIARTSHKLSHGRVESSCVIELCVGVTGRLNRPCEVAPIVTLEKAQSHSHQRTQVLDIR